MVPLVGVGLGLRREFIDTFLSAETHPDFIELPLKTGWALVADMRSY